MTRRLLESWLVVLLCVVVAGASTTEKPAEKPKDDYYELYKVLVDTVDQVERNYVKEVDRRELIEAAIEGVLQKLDPYSSYIAPKEIDRFRANVESEFGGIGIQVAVDDGQLKIISPLVGTPGYRAGLLAGDRIVEIEGKGTDGVSVDEAVRRLKGAEGSSVTLTVIHPGRMGKETVTIKRERIHVDTVLGDRRKADDSWDFMLRPKDGIAYIRLNAFSRETAKELRLALDELQKVKMRGLILDLRFNPGGLLNAAVEVSDLFISEGRIVSTQGRAGPERIWDAHKEDTFLGFPMVVLVNRYSASASEIVAACLQDHQRAVVLGERTWGKGSVQNVIELEGGRSALKLTTAAYRRPNGKNIHRFEDSKDSDEWGVVPDKGFEVKLGENEMADLVEHRRQRDIVQPRSSPEPQADAGSSNPKANDKTPKTDGQKSNGKKPAASETESNDSPVVDRQLEAAVKYLTDELGKAK